MGQNASLRSLALYRRRLAYALALALPLLCAMALVHLHWLHAYPFWLFFISVTIVAALGGWTPMFLAVFAVLIVRSAFLDMPLDPADYAVADRYRLCFLLFCGTAISFVSQRRLNSEIKLALALDALQERTDALIDSLNTAKCASWTLDYDTAPHVRWYSGSFPIFGVPYSEVEAMPSVVPLVHPEDQQRVAELGYHFHHSDQPVVFEYRCLWPNGELHWLEMRGTRIPGPRPRWRGLTLDVTERRASEAAILRAEKLAAMGRLASTVAHEINNPLEAVTNLLYLALLDPSLSTEARGFLTTAEGELARLAGVTRFTLDYTPAHAVSTQVDLAEALDDVLSIFNHRVEVKRAVIERRYSPGTAVAVAHHELRQILTNLLANAADAIMDISAPRLLIEVIADATIATVTLADNGSGIDPAHLNSVFEPFYSTKADVGTGLGLWVTRELVQKNGGRIHVLSGSLPDGMSTSFRIEFPLATRAI